MKAVAATADQAPSVETVGVGIVLKPSFQSDTFLALVVHSLVPGSSAEQSRMIQVCRARPHADSRMADLLAALSPAVAASVVAPVHPTSHAIWGSLQFGAI